jgi:hypothetical protein
MDKSSGEIRNQKVVSSSSLPTKAELELLAVRDPAPGEQFLANVFTFGWGDDGRLGM